MASTDSPELITPAGPSVLDAIMLLPIDALDVFNYAAANAYIIPELLDAPRFAAALAKTLVLFPLYGARVRCEAGGGVPWVITLPPAGLPLTLASNPSTDPLIMPSSAVIQRPLPFLPPLTPPRKIVLDPTAPLAAVLLTHFPNLGVTCIGITRWHPIGSDWVASRFIRALSSFYVHLNEPISAPIHKPLRSFLPTPTDTDRRLLDGIDTSAVQTYYNPTTSPHPQLSPSPAHPANVRLDFRLSGAQVETIRTAIQTASPVVKLSAQDCLVALIAVATNAADPSTPPIRTIDTILDVRGVAGVPAELAWNGWTFAMTETIEVSSPSPATNSEDGDGNLHNKATQYYAYAAAVRHSLLRARDPAFLAAMVDLQASRAAEAAARGEGELLDLASPPGRMCVNSTLRLDTSTHFGQQVRGFAASVPFVRHVKLARPNPRPYISTSTITRGSSTGNPEMQTQEPQTQDAEAGAERLPAVESTLFFVPSVRERFREEMEVRVRELGAGRVEWVE
ncbi:hypothetical protein B0H12DRAFT_1129478 [Mycena haematopus]|nr:hypothetical protein B0H12DRAFT_1129478 [Mycena haematopus]